MSAQRRQTLLVAVMLALLVLAAGYALLRMRASQDDAQSLAAELVKYRQIADNIERLRSVDAVAANADDMQQQEAAMAQLITDAGNKVGLTGDWFGSNNPGDPVPVGDTPYQRKPTEVRLNKLTLPQITALLHELTHDASLTVQDLDLSRPERNTAEDTWVANFTLTYLIFKPKTAN